MTERRFEQRVPFEILLNTHAGDFSQRGFATNVSAGGLYLSTPRASRPVPHTRRVELELALPGLGQPLWIQGEICHDEPGAYFLGRGVRFTAVPDELSAWLQRLTFEEDPTRPYRDPRYVLSRRLELRMGQSYWKPAASSLRCWS